MPIANSPSTSQLECFIVPCPILPPTDIVYKSKLLCSSHGVVVMSWNEARASHLSEKWKGPCQAGVLPSTNSPFTSQSECFIVPCLILPPTDIVYKLKLLCSSDGVVVMSWNEARALHLSEKWKVIVWLIQTPYLRIIYYSYVGNTLPYSLSLGLARNSTLHTRHCHRSRNGISQWISSLAHCFWVQ